MTIRWLSDAFTLFPSGVKVGSEQVMETVVKLWLDVTNLVGGRTGPQDSTPSHRSSSLGATVQDSGPMEMCPQSLTRATLNYGIWSNVEKVAHANA